MPWAAEPLDLPPKLQSRQGLTMRVEMSNPRACDMMTGAFPCWSSPHRKCKRQANLGFLDALRPRQRDRTGRNMKSVP